MSLHRVNPAAMHPPTGRYSHATRVLSGATLVYVAGQAGIDRSGRVLAGFEAQMHQAWANFITVLETEGMTPGDLVHVNHYLIDPAHVDSFRIIRARYLPDPPPTATTLIVARLVAPEWLIEIDGVAARFSN